MINPRKPNQIGQELLEYALILPVFVFLVFGVLDLGRAVYYWSAIFNATREGARWAIVHPPETEAERTTIATQVDDKVISHALAVTLIASDINTTWYDPSITTPNPPTSCPNSQALSPNPPPAVCVVTQYSFVPVTPLISGLFPGGQVTLRTASTMYLEFLP